MGETGYMRMACEYSKACEGKRQKKRREYHANTITAKKRHQLSRTDNTEERENTEHTENGPDGSGLRCAQQRQWFTAKVAKDAKKSTRGKQKEATTTGTTDERG